MGIKAPCFASRKKVLPTFMRFYQIRKEIGNEESVRGVVRSWRIERELKKQEAAPPESLDASNGETAEVTPSPAYILPQQNRKTICDQVHNCGGELLPDMEKELWGKECLGEAIREYLSRQYRAKVEDLKIRFIVQNKKAGLKVSYTRNKIVEREKTFIPEEAIGKDPDAELIFLLIQVVVDEWHKIKDALEEPSNFARCFQAFSLKNKVPTMDEVQQLQRENTELRKENKELQEGIEKLEKSLRKTEATLQDVRIEKAKMEDAMEYVSEKLSLMVEDSQKFKTMMGHGV